METYEVEMYADSESADQIIVITICARAHAPDEAMDEALVIARMMFRDDVTFTVIGAKLVA